ncbi:D-2-hydroxyglutarate dehydrogenase YdiJ [Thorsellia kenyensis]|uniref:FAD-binding and (Fe-S)-binding domain-containing protein n=1 Tax=Thorsellia kenyensis TaxID=1549888 RepID=A0ABV6C765_9GAMM
MIPKLTSAPSNNIQVTEFLKRLKASGFTGEVTDTYSDRLTLATDNSVYQSLPQAIIFPKSTADVSLMAKIAGLEEYQTLSFAPRGGGTGTNGQSLTSGIVVDMSRHMNHILEVNVEERWIRVEAGVVKDALNAFLKPLGYFFSPELSTSNRATIGGMINTDASGQGSLVYGKTSDHVLGLNAVLISGDLLEAFPMPLEIAKEIAKQNTPTGRIYHHVIKTCLDYKEQIIEKFPPLNRFLTGYDLKHALDDKTNRFDLTRILAGSEGSLAFITEAKLNITPLPKHRRLININYDSFDSALRAAPVMLKANALSVETIDSSVLNLAKEDIVWSTVNNLVSALDDTDKIQGLNMVEYASDDEALIEQQVKTLCEMLDDSIQMGQGVLGYRLCDKVEEIERVYAMRKKAVGLLGNTKGTQKPVAFVEDTCVPPDSLADYILEFRALLDNYGLTYGMFGHVDAGVLHVRPALDLIDPVQEELLHTITEDVVRLTKKYGGLLWGEHGKGYRAAYSPEFFGPELYKALRIIKGAFDANNRVNPGKICTPIQSDTAELISIKSLKRGAYDRQIPVVVRESFIGAMSCNGNGLCFNYDKHAVMCPSMKVTSNRLHSPKGRAMLVREWLRLLTEKGVTPKDFNEALTMNKSVTSIRFFREIVEKTKNTLSKRKGEYDFSHEVKIAMDGCLSCKACATECPIKIDVPDFKAQFYHMYHSRYLRPIKDHVLAHIETLVPFLAKVPKATNIVVNNRFSEHMIKKIVGLQDLPALAIPTLKQRVERHPSAFKSIEAIKQLNSNERKDYVFIVQDAFTTFYEAKVLEDLLQLLDILGFKPVILPFKANGKAQQVKGILNKFHKTVQQTADYLNEIAELNIPMIGVDAATVLCYRDEYVKTLGKETIQFKVSLIQEWLLPCLEHRKEEIDRLMAAVQKGNNLKEESSAWTLFLHCTERTKVVSSFSDWQRIFALFNQSLLSENVGCCGMAGTYGHEVEHVEESKALFVMSWQEKLDKKEKGKVLATGFSCRSQAKRFSSQELLHPVSALLHILQGNDHEKNSFNVV